MPIRIQRMRTRGWKMPENAVYVGRPTKLGNNYIVGTLSHDDPPIPLSAEDAVALFEEFQVDEMRDDDIDFNELRGKDLVCWCPLDQPCHADVLLEIANAAPLRPSATSPKLGSASNLGEVEPPGVCSLGYDMTERGGL